MTFPIKKRINTELFIDKTAALLIVDEHTVKVVNNWHWLYQIIFIIQINFLKKEW